jgi:hypothetical protein
MSYENIQIQVRGFNGDINSVDDIQELNFFSTPQTLFPDDRYGLLDITRYLKKISPINYKFEVTTERKGSEFGGGADELVYETSFLTIELSALNFELESFFQTTRPANSSTVKKYVLFLNYNYGQGFRNEFIGIINQSDITEHFDLESEVSNTDKVIKIKAYDAQKEAAEYYKYKQLPEINSGWNSIGSTVSINYDPYNPPQNITLIQHQQLRQVIGEVFNTVDNTTEWRLRYNGYSYQVARFQALYTNFDISTAEMQKDTYCALWWIRSGYARSVTQGTTRWDWLKYICNSWGWAFKFNFNLDSNNNIYKEVTLAERSLGFLNRSKMIDWSNVIDYDLSKDKETQTYNNIVIIDGAHEGGDNVFKSTNNGGQFNGSDINEFNRLKGIRVYKLGQQYEPRLNNCHFNAVNQTGSYPHSFIQLKVETLNEPIPNTPYYFYKYDKEDDRNFYIYKIYNPGGAFQPVTLPKHNTLFLETGDDTDHQHVRRVTNAQGNADDAQYIWSPGYSSLDNNDMNYYGCYGHQVFIRDDVFSPFATQQYWQFVRTEDFRNNFISFLDTYDVMRVQITLNGVYENIIENDIYFQGDNMPLPFSINENVYWRILEAEIDYLNEVTQLVLVRTVS